MNLFDVYNPQLEIEGAHVAIQFSHKAAAQIVQSEIRAMTIECEKVNGINLAQGVCDTELPTIIQEKTQEGIRGGINSYTRYDGLSELRQAIAKKTAGYNKICADPETEIIVSAGSTGSFYCACLAFLNPGDEVILFEPYYGYHVNTLLVLDAVPTYVTMNAPQWTFTPEILDQAVTSRTKGILVNTPANPSGKVFTETELGWIADCAIRHDLIVFTDEIYEYFLYDGLKHISPATIPGIADRTITISGFSKTFSVTGWRIGYSICNPNWALMIGYMNDLIYVCAPAPLQYGVALGMDGLPSGFFHALVEEYTKKRDRICTVLKEAGMEPAIPQGAYYVLADVSRLPGATSKAKAMYLLDKTGVASVPGEAFYHGSTGKNLVRFCFAKKDQDLDDACERLKKLAQKTK